MEPLGLSDPGRFCERCGIEYASGDHAGCSAALALEPPRYCRQCARRMVVQVTPNGWSASCTRHGARVMTAR